MGKSLLAIVGMAGLLACVHPSSSRNDASAEFVDLTWLDPTIRLDIRYATDNNFTGQAVYPCPRCLLRKDVAQKLVRVQQALRT